MPLIKVSKDPREVEILEEIGATLMALGVSQKELARRAKINPSTLNARMHDIGSLRLSELWAIRDVKKRYL